MAGGDRDLGRHERTDAVQHRTVTCPAGPVRIDRWFSRVGPAHRCSVEPNSSPQQITNSQPHNDLTPPPHPVRNQQVNGCRTCGAAPQRSSPFAGSMKARIRGDTLWSGCVPVRASGGWFGVSREPGAIHRRKERSHRSSLLPDPTSGRAHGPTTITLGFLRETGRHFGDGDRAC